MLLADDPEYQAKKTRTEAEFAERSKALGVAAKPIVDDLRRVCVDVESP